MSLVCGVLSHAYTLPLATALPAFLSPSSIDLSLWMGISIPNPLNIYTPFYYIAPTCFLFIQVYVPKLVQNWSVSNYLVFVYMLR